MPRLFTLNLGTGRRLSTLNRVVAIAVTDDACNYSNPRPPPIGASGNAQMPRSLLPSGAFLFTAGGNGRGGEFEPWKKEGEGRNLAASEDSVREGVIASTDEAAIRRTRTRLPRAGAPLKGAGTLALHCCEEKPARLRHAFRTRHHEESIGAEEIDDPAGDPDARSEFARRRIVTRSGALSGVAVANLFSEERSSLARNRVACGNEARDCARSRMIDVPRVQSAGTTDRRERFEILRKKCVLFFENAKGKKIAAVFPWPQLDAKSNLMEN